MKKILSLFFALTLCTTAYADGIVVDIDRTNMTMNVSGSIGTQYSGEYVTLKIVKDGDTGETVFFDQQNANTDGDYSFSNISFLSDTGYYSFYVTGADEDVPVYKKEKVFVPTVTGVNVFLNKINSASGADTVMEILASEISSPSAGFEFDYYDALPQNIKTAICTDVEKNKPYVVTDFEKKFNTFTVLNVLLKSNDPNLIYPLLTLDEATLSVGLRKTVTDDCGLSKVQENSVFKALAQYGETEYKALISSMKTGNLSIDEFYDSIETAYINAKLAALDNWTEVYPLISAHSDIFPEDDYKSYSGSSKREAIDKLILKSKLETTASLAEYVKSASQDSGQQGGSTSGGGSKKGNTVSGSVTLAEAKNDIFSDVSDTCWAKEYIEYLYSAGVVSGNDAKQFLPDDNIKREEFAKMVFNAFKISDMTGKSFSDVADDAWYSRYIRALSAAGYINGISDDRFGVGENITRQDAAAILGRIINISVENAMPAFSDTHKISDYAAGYVAALANKGIINGYNDGTFRPDMFITRAEAAKIIASLIRK